MSDTMTDAVGASFYRQATVLEAADLRRWILDESAKALQASVASWLEIDLSNRGAFLPMFGNW